MGSHHHDLYDRRRKGSVDSYRSHRSRSRSADSYGRRHRSRSVDDRFRKDSLRDQLPALETLTEAPDKTDPPTYDESQADAQSGDSEKGKQGGAQKKELALWWSFAPLLPLLIGLFLLFIVTCSASRLRADFALIKIQLDAEDYSALYTATLDQQTRRKRDAAGYLTLGTWGWCVKSADSRQTSCSRTSGWYSMDQLLDNTNSGLSSDDFNSFLVHLLILHGLALLITLLAVVPVSLSAWRQYRRDTNSQPGWFQHGTILASASLALVAWTIDKILKHSVASNANAYTVESGQVKRCHF
ncbi:hypothetical protein BD324DRAFT_636223 [Kockovaella imperatae]|uniref:Uncharacterized protein n=1 Tax=Kockovaella imperatae TaxID=4999 RepID=A0A1Y1U916_9TREE|nr:hypothetical protein BD324DRAFT_636223 [Kockovaella imperatae]ORX34520.1 hypothetical protein BD324DRAFT_636223 [Kockovaella imperatae]